jgi:outer membrane protein OmpA-like peptidoglycan-associated protein
MYPKRFGVYTSNKEFRMKTTSKLVLGVAVAIISTPSLAAGTMNNSEVWTTANGSAIVDSSGNSVRTIHYLNKAVAAIQETSKATPSLIAVIKKAVAKVFNTEPEIVLVADPAPVVTEEVIPEPVKEEVVAVVAEKEPVPEPKPQPEPEPVKAEVVIIIEAEPEIIIEAPVVIALLAPVKVEYSFNDYAASILFDTNSATLSADASGSLTQLAMATRHAERVLSVKLFGYADSRGDHDYNMALSAKRMLSVEEFLSGLSLNVTSRFAKGETSPVVGSDGEDLALSRRVDVAIKTRRLKD